MVASGKFHVMHMETIETVFQRFEVEEVMEKAEVFLYLRVPGVVPINDGWRFEFHEEKLVIAFKRNLLDRFAILNAKFDALRFSRGHELVQHLVSMGHGLLFFLLAPDDGFLEQFLE